MKRLLYLLVVLIFAFVLISCKKTNNEDDDNYLDKKIIVNELKDYVSGVLNNEHLIDYIESSYSNLQLTDDTYPNALKEAKEALFNLEKELLIGLAGLESNYFAEISDINYLYPYAAIKNSELTQIIYNFNKEYLDEDYLITLHNNDPYYMFNDDFELISNDLFITEQLLNSLVKQDNKYHLFVVSKSNTYKITLKEIGEGKPYIINPNIYSDFSDDVVIILEMMGGELSISDTNLNNDYYTIDDNQIIINKDYLKGLFLDDRKSFIFGISIYLNNTYYLETIHIIKK